MAFDAFLKFSTIPAAESQDQKYPGTAGWIDVLSFMYNVSQTSASSTGGGQAAGKANMGDFSFTQKYHRGSVQLFLQCCTGKHIPEATFVARKAGGTQLDFLKLEFKECMITSVNTSCSGTDEIPVETVTVTYSEVNIVYTEQDSKTGAAKGAAAKGGYNQKLNKLLA
jgi:type VI secretion system secreted protein Hcp